MGNRLDGKNPLAYMGVRPSTPPQLMVEGRAPTQNDLGKRVLGTQWLYIDPNNINESLQYVLVSVEENIATWLPLNEADEIILPDHSVALGTGAVGLNSTGPEANLGYVLASNGLAADPTFQAPEDLITLPDHAVALGTGAPGLNSVAPIATLGAALISNGVAADPTFGVVSVSGGGTGLDVCDQYAVYCGGITGEGPVQQVAGLGTSGQVLTSNGAGLLPTWQAGGGGGGGTGGPIAVQVFTVAGAHTYTPSVGMASCFVECIGAGGGGAGMPAIGAAAQRAGGGGGGYCRKLFLATDLAATEPLVIGTGGAGGAAGAENAGVNGGATTFGTGPLLTAGGGNGAASMAFEVGGAGGVAVNGDINVNGSAGGGTPTQGVVEQMSGTGGSSFYSAPGIAPYDASTAGPSYGAGGSGAASTTGASTAGGNGANGIIIITEYGPYAPTPPSAPFTLNTILLDAPGADTYTPSVGMFQCVVECVGGGAGSGPLHIPAAFPSSGGGGAGGYCKKLFDAATIGANQPVFIGDGGSGINFPPLVPPTDGQATTFGAFLTANGGLINDDQGNGGLGGTAVGGDINIQGQAGTRGVMTPVTTGVGFAAGNNGNGGNSIYGFGGIGSSPYTSGDGLILPATGYGSGGAYAPSPSPLTDCAGRSGVIIITEYIS